MASVILSGSCVHVINEKQPCVNMNTHAPTGYMFFCVYVVVWFSRRYVHLFTYITDTRINHT